MATDLENIVKIQLKKYVGFSIPLESIPSIVDKILTNDILAKYNKQEVIYIVDKFIFYNSMDKTYYVNIKNKKNKLLT